MAQLNIYEGNILLFIQEHLRAAWLDGPMWLVSTLGNVGMLWIIITLALLVMRKTRRWGVASAIALLIGLVITNIALKNLVQRVRPYDVLDTLTLVVAREKDFSFPSGHACASFAAAWTLFRTTDKRWGVPALIMACLIALSRLYVGVHYPTDVICGTLMGILAAEISIRITRRIPAGRELPAWPK